MQDNQLTTNQNELGFRIAMPALINSIFGYLTGALY